VPEQVTEPAAGDEAGRVGEGVAADDELQRDRARVQLVLQGREGDVHDVRVEAVHDHGGEGDRQQQAAPALWMSHATGSTNRWDRQSMAGPGSSVILQS
jgi:hypothetical protein